MQAQEEGPGEDEQAANLQKFLRGSTPGRMRVSGMMEYLKSMALSDRIPPRQRDGLMRISKTITRIVDQTREEASIPNGVLEKLDSLTKTVADLDSRLDMMVPKNRK
jgi:hypothetical protein